MSYAAGAALVVLAGVIWSTMGLVIRQFDLAGTWAILFWRSAGAVPVLLAVISVNAGGSPLPRLRAVGWPGLIGGAGLVLAFAGAIFAIQSTTVANAVFLFTASPFLAAILGWLVLGEKVASTTWAAIALAILGILVMVGSGLDAGALAGNLAALLSAAGFALFSVTLRWGRAGDMMPAVVIGAALSMAAGLAGGMVSGQPVLALPAIEIALALALGAVILAGGMVLYTLGSRVLPAADLTLMSLVEVMLAPVWVFLALGETASPATFAGGAIVLAAVVLNAVAGARRRRQNGTSSA